MVEEFFQEKIFLYKISAKPLFDLRNSYFPNEAGSPKAKEQCQWI